MTPNFRLYSIIGAYKDGNTLLKRKQYAYNSLSLAKHITQNKILNQLNVLKLARNKSDSVKEAIVSISDFYSKISDCTTLNEILAYEGLSAKLYFKNHFNNLLWQGRQPRLKRDTINAVLDIGYTILFAYVDAILESFGFDVYCGVMHTQFYMRKSLVCDIVEPFRPLIDSRIKKAYNLKQIKSDDFVIINNQYRLKWDKTPNYISFLMKPIMDNKSEIFSYIHEYYMSFMKESTIDKYPMYLIN